MEGTARGCSGSIRAPPLRREAERLQLEPHLLIERIAMQKNIGAYGHLLEDSRQLPESATAQIEPSQLTQMGEVTVQCAQLFIAAQAQLHQRASIPQALRHLHEA